MNSTDVYGFVKILNFGVYIFNSGVQWTSTEKIEEEESKDIQVQNCRGTVSSFLDHPINL